MSKGKAVRGDLLYYEGGDDVVLARHTSDPFFEAKTDKGMLLIDLREVMAIEQFTAEVDRQHKTQAGLILNKQTISRVNFLMCDGSALPCDCSYDDAVKAWKAAK